MRIVDGYLRHGFKIAPDDLSTGYPGLARMAELRPDIVRIDRLLVKDRDTDRHRLAIIAGMVQIGAEPGIEIIVEGVERLEEVQALRSIGTRFIQGFCFARPSFERITLDADIPWLVRPTDGIHPDWRARLRIRNPGEAKDDPVAAGEPGRSSVRCNALSRKGAP